jgi:hypothetical protein
MTWCFTLRFWGRVCNSIVGLLLGLDNPFLTWARYRGILFLKMRAVLSLSLSYDVYLDSAAVVDMCACACAVL